MDTKTDILTRVKAEFEAAMGGPDGEIATERAKAYDYYMRKPLGNEVEGQSQVVSSDVADVVDGIMPSLLRIFTTADNVCNFEPVGEEDVEVAKQESDYVNHVFFKENDSFMVMYNWFFDALVSKNGVVKCWQDESTRVTQETYEGLTEDDLVELLDDDELEPIERESRITSEMGPDGVEVEVVLYDVTFKRRKKYGCQKVANVPPDEFRISSDARGLDPSAARFVGHERPVPRSELLAMGFERDVVDDLPAYGDAIKSQERQARQDKSDEMEGQSAADHWAEEVLLGEGYLKVTNDDGDVEIHQVFVCGDTLLSDEIVDRQPFHVLCAHPLPHKHFGLATAEKVMDVMELNSVLLRQILDNLYQTNNPGHAVWDQGMGENTLDDLLTTRVGRVVQFSRPVAESWSPMAVPFTAGATFPMLEYFGKVKRDRTGISSDSEGLSPEALKNIQTGVLAQANDVSRMKIEAIARIFAETGIKSLFLHIHELILKHQNKPKIVRLRGQFVPVDPRLWRDRYDMTVQIGLGIGNRETNLMHLEAIWNKQAQIVQSGGMNLLVTPDNIFNTAAEFVRNANLKDPSMFFTNPQGQMAPPPSSEQQQLEQQAMQLEQRRQMLDGQAQEIKIGRLQLDAERERLRHQVEMLDLKRKTDKDDDWYRVEMQKVKNELTELGLKYAGGNQ